MLLLLFSPSLRLLFKSPSLHLLFKSARFFHPTTHLLLHFVRFKFSCSLVSCSLLLSLRARGGDNQFESASVTPWFHAATVASKQARL
jgi:hypothetical protein